MKKFNVVSCAAAAALAGIGAPVSANTITLSDNGVHYFDSTIAQINLRNATTLHVDEPANITTTLDATNQTMTHFNGGSIRWIFLWHQAALEMLGGSNEELYVNNRSTADIRGGSVGEVFTYSSSVVDIRGGDIGAMRLHGSSTINIYGMEDLELRPLVPLLNYIRYKLVGTLQDGSPIDAWVWLDGSSGASPELNLIIQVIPLPGPAGMGLAGLGALCAVRRRRG
ncbi:MAG: hypothetical protein EA423_01130 [Phycisphaerales bacterium]|nr:MAG: hypothetical protein EA423_01130 [Phycisphaerales bacterium]